MERDGGTRASSGAVLEVGPDWRQLCFPAHRRRVRRLRAASRAGSETRASEAEIAELLTTFERVRMGLKRDVSEQLRPLAGEIICWFEESQRSWLEFGPVRR